MQEFQQFQAWKLQAQSQAQAQSFVDLTEPQEEIDISGEVISKPRRSTSVKRSRSQAHSDQVQSVLKRAKSATTTSQRSLSPRRDYMYPKYYNERFQKMNCTLKMSEDYIKPESSVQNLGLHIESNVSMDKQISSTIKSVYYQLRSISKIRKYLNKDTCAKVK